jgi:aminocarboxymuconate-semialdehyde decarboxylase
MPVSPVVDVHTHMLDQQWVDALLVHGGPRYRLARANESGPKLIHVDGIPFMTPLPEMFDYDIRIKNMDKAKVDIAIVSLTCPNVFFGGEEISASTARLVNDSMAAAQRLYPDRIRWFASLPWQYPSKALAELARARDLGAVGVITLGNIDGKSLTDPVFAEIWQSLDNLDMPVFVHPTAPPGVRAMDMASHNLIPPVGFVFDTTIAITRCIYDGFFDRYPNIRLIAGHGGGAIPYLVGRLDICHQKIPGCSTRTSELPSSYLKRIYLDSVVYTSDALEMCIKVCGTENVLFGSDYPHNIGDMVGHLERVDSLPHETARLVRGGNAVKMFGL